MHFRHHPLIHFGPHLLQVMERAPHFLLRLGSAILQPAVLQARVMAGSPAVFPCPVTEKGFHWVVAAASFVARSSLEPGLFARPVSGLCRCVICPATVDLVIAAVDLFSLPVPDLAAVVVAAVVVAAVVVAAAVVAAAVVAAAVVAAAVAVAADSAATVAAVDPGSAASVAVAVGFVDPVFVVAFS